MIVACVQIVAVVIFILEWVSPSGFNMKMEPAIGTLT